MDERFNRLINDFFHWKINLEIPFKDAFDDYHMMLFSDICGEDHTDKIEIIHSYDSFGLDDGYKCHPIFIYDHAGEGISFNYSDIFKLLDKLLGTRYEY